MKYHCYIDPKVLMNIADETRNKYNLSKVPIEVEKHLENIGVSIIPLPGLLRCTAAKAFITSDWQQLYVDKWMYDSDYYQDELRFAYAHEYGHMVCHSDVYSSYNISSFDDFYNWYENISQAQYDNIETQASIFANNFLVPRDLLKEQLNIYYKKCIESGYSTISKESINYYISPNIANYFGVTVPVANMAISTLGNYCIS